jgi:hypothetical protein
MKKGVFVFGPAKGQDKVRDFSNGQDRLDVTSRGFAPVAEAKSHFASIGWT